MKLEELTHGREAAELLGVARADSVWRAIDQHGRDYPGSIEVVAVGRMKAVPREQLRSFADWYNQTVRPAAAERERDPVAVTDARREALRRAIGRIEEDDEVMM